LLTPSPTHATGGSRFLPANLGDLGEIRRLAEQVGDIDVLVNNAGHSAWGPTADLDVASFDSMFADNVRAPFYLVAAFAPGMAARGKGSWTGIHATGGKGSVRQARRHHAAAAPRSDALAVEPLPRWLVRVSQLPLFLAVTPGR